MSFHKFIFNQGNQGNQGVRVLENSMTAADSGHTRTHVYPLKPLSILQFLDEGFSD